MAAWVGRSDTFGDLLRHHRLAAGLTQEELAARSGLSVRALSDIERGRSARPYRKSVSLLAAALGLEPAEASRFQALSRPGVPTGPTVTAPQAEAARPAGAVPRQLPATVPHFVGRECELAELSMLLTGQVSVNTHAPAVVVITGSAGVGKSALAVRWGHQAAHHFPAGQLYVNLRGFHPADDPVSPAAVVQWFLAALAVPPEQIPAAVDAQLALYRSVVAERALLVVLDNARDAEQVRPLLPGGARCMTIVTSRRQLRGLVASEGAHAMHLGVLRPDEALAMLHQRIGLARSAAEPTAAAEIVAFCGQLPLAVAVVAACLSCGPYVTLGALLEDLKDPLKASTALRTGDAETTVSVVFSWSYHQLQPATAELFRLLAVHPGSTFSTAAAASLCARPVAKARDLIAELTDLNLLTQVEYDRFSCHDLLRDYAGRCAEADEDPQALSIARRRLLRWYLHTAAAAALAMNPLQRQVAAEAPDDCVRLQFCSKAEGLRWLEAERDNLMAATRDANRYGEDEVGWKLPVAMWDLFIARAYWADWIEADELGLACARKLDDQAAEAWLLTQLAVAYFQSGDRPRAIGCLEQGIELRRRSGDAPGEASALANLGKAYSEMGELTKALKHLGAALAIFRTTGARAHEGICLFMLGGANRRAGNLSQALDNAKTAVAILTEVGLGAEVPGAFRELAATEVALGDVEEAASHARQGLSIARDNGERIAESELLVVLADALEGGGQLPEAERTRAEAFTIWKSVGDPRAADLVAQAVVRGEGTSAELGA